jgi:hypothetical protein
MRFTLSEGTEAGVEIIEVKTGAGFRFWASPSRGLDILFAEHDGRPLCWQSPTGFAHPAYFSDDNLGWLRGFGGGLLTTCGLQSIGPPCETEGEKFGLHDRASYLPATNVAVREEWSVGADGAESCEWSISGDVRQARVFGPNLLLSRTISARLGESNFTIRDRVRNEGFRREGLAILYHCNWGFPVVSEHSVIRAPSIECEARDEVAKRGIEQWKYLPAPEDGFEEQVFFHQMEADDEWRVRAEIWNEQLDWGGYVRYRADTLKYFTQWKMAGAGTYVCGLEPSNVPLLPRSELLSSGMMPFLEPGQSVEFELELGARRAFHVRKEARWGREAAST